MPEIIQIPDPKVALTLAELKAIQSIAASHLTFSLTLACPLKCSHCIVNAGPELGKTTMPFEVAAGYAEQMTQLAEYGIRSISFTGGEPLLAPRQLEVLANAANRAGIAGGVVTAAHWAKTLDSARATVARYSAINCWDLSVDVFHEEYLGLECIQNAYDALLEAEKRVTIRFTYSDPPTEDELRILEYITTLKDAAFSCQRVRAVGRGSDLSIEPSYKHNPWMKPCLTQGMVIRYDGTISPCCLNLVEERRHPFQFGDARSRPLKVIHQEYMSMPLLQMIRAIGFADLMRWLEEAGLDSRLPKNLPDEICDICSLMMRDRTIADFLVQKTSDPEVQLKIAVTASRVLGENQMLTTIVNRLAANGTQNEEVAVAQEFLEVQC